MLPSHACYLPPGWHDGSSIYSALYLPGGVFGIVYRCCDQHIYTGVDHHGPCTVVDPHRHDCSILQLDSYVLHNRTSLGGQRLCISFLYDDVCTPTRRRSKQRYTVCVQHETGRWSRMLINLKSNNGAKACLMDTTYRQSIKDKVKACRTTPKITL